MKNLHLILMTALLANLIFPWAAPAQAGAPVATEAITLFPYTESFEGDSHGWAIINRQNSSWELGVPADNTISSASQGVKAWTTGLETDYNVSEESFVFSPLFDFLGMTVDPIISMDVWWEIAPDYGSAGAVLQYTTGDPTSTDTAWTTVGSQGDPQNWYTHSTLYGLMWSNPGDGSGWSGRDGGGSNAWRTATHRLDGAAGKTNVTLRVAFGSDGASPTDDGFAFDNVRIYSGAAAPGCAIQPTPTTGAADVYVSTQLNWTGGTGIPTGYRISFGTTNPPTNNVDLGTNTAYDPAGYLAFNTPYYWQVIPYNAYGDATSCPVWSFTTNNIPLMPVSIDAPYIEGFEGSSHGWASGGTNSSWAVGTPAGTVIQGASGGSNAWMTGLTDGYNDNEQSSVVSPFFDFSALEHPYVKFDLWWDAAEEVDGARLEYSTDGGATWITAGGESDGFNWYNFYITNDAPAWSGSMAEDAATFPFYASHGWRTALHNLDWLAGEPNVRLRFFFDATGSSGYDGFAFDNFEVRGGCTWLDGREDDWHNSENWNCGHAPGANEIAEIIAPGEGYSPIISSGVGQAAAVAMRDSSMLTLAGGNLQTSHIYRARQTTIENNNEITLSGSGITWEASDGAETPGLVTYGGSGPQRIVGDVLSGVYPVQFTNLQVNGGATLVASSNLNATTLTVQANGTFDLGLKNLTVSDALTNNGTLRQKQVVVGTAGPVNFLNTGGYGGLTLEPNSQNLGETTVHIHGNQDYATNAVKRGYHIASSSDPVSGVKLTFYFAQADIPAGTSCDTLEAFRRNGSAWDKLTRDTTYGVDGRNCTSQPYSIQVLNVTNFSEFIIASGNLAPSVALTNTVTNLPVDADTSSAIKVADIVVTDDGIGTNVLSLSGADAALFEIVGTELRLKSGTTLNFATNPTLDVTVEVNDSTIGDTPDDTAALTISITAYQCYLPLVIRSNPATP